MILVSLQQFIILNDIKSLGRNLSRHGLESWLLVLLSAYLFHLKSMKFNVQW